MHPLHHYLTISSSEGTYFIVECTEGFNLNRYCPKPCAAACHAPGAVAGQELLQCSGAGLQKKKHIHPLKHHIRLLDWPFAP